MQPPTAQAKTATIRFIETGRSYLMPISVPQIAEPVEPNQSVGAENAQTLAPNKPFENLSFNLRKLSFDAEWLSGVEQRIMASVPAEGYPPTGNTAWLNQQVALSSLEFFKSTSTVLPGRAVYLRASRAGDLVAEFSAPKGKMTCLISPKFILVFALVGEETVEKRFLPGKQSADKLRSEILAVKNLLSVSPHATLAAKS